MRSQLRIGKGRQYLEDKAAQGDKSAQAEIAKIVDPESMFLWDAFFALSRSRPPGMSGPSSIPISEIHAYCQFIGLNNVDSRCRVLNAVQALDGELLDWFEKQNKTPKRQ